MKKKEAEKIIDEILEEQPEGNIPKDMLKKWGVQSLISHSASKKEGR